MNEKELLTLEERRIVDKLESEMLFASTRTHMNFYKNEIQTIITQAKRRHTLLKSYSKQAMV